MRLVLVHGINNQSYTVDEIRATWLSGLEQGWKELDLYPSKPFTCEVAYYADILANVQSENEGAVKMGTEGPSSGLAIEFLRAYAENAGVTEADLQMSAAEMNMPQEVIEQGVPHEGWVIAFAQVLERVLPTKGKYLAKWFLPQAANYINNPVLADKISRTINGQVFEGKPDPMVVIGHSLGSVVAYRMLAASNFEKRSVPLFVTLGSPLSLEMFRVILPKRGTLPNPPISRWINGRNREDFVTLGKAITRKSIGFDGVEDVTDVIDNEANRHDIATYLRSPKIAQAIYDVIEAW